MVLLYGIIVSQEVKKSAIYNHTDNFTKVAVDTDSPVGQIYIHFYGLG